MITNTFTTKIPTLRSHPQQCGMALIEILVSMFILALGIMALLATQVRTSSGIREAENMSIVVAATENLANGLMINPTLQLRPGTNDPGTNAVYDKYAINNCNNHQNPPPSSSTYGSLTRDQLANGQLAQFCTAMLSIPGMDSENIKMKICNNDRISAGELPFNFSCGSSGGNTVIKVAWRIKKSQNDPNAASYSYQYILSK